MKFQLTKSYFLFQFQFFIFLFRNIAFTYTYSLKLRESSRVVNKLACLLNHTVVFRDCVLKGCIIAIQLMDDTKCGSTKFQNT